MSATDPDLSDQELTILAIAAEGESMIPLGQWEAAVERLVTLGYLVRTGSPGDPTGRFNNRITARGRARAKAQDDADLMAIIGLNNEIVRRKEAADAPGDAGGDIEPCGQDGP